MFFIKKSVLLRKNQKGFQLNPLRRCIHQYLIHQTPRLVVICGTRGLLPIISLPLRAEPPALPLKIEADHGIQPASTLMKLQPAITLSSTPALMTIFYKRSINPTKLNMEGALS
ncbi:hypothetical protein [Pseudomonas viridiflava]|uniref:hypothetical protein n=1 Tax=Pseudomonas viridiflava TaxID=33069 RepID=UPI000F08C87D|nr:hypothetical protein [Pseudomonas viridiflava]